MTTANHAYTGAAIALSVQRPFLALLLALMSHYALDALPHYGVSGENVIQWTRHKLTWAVEGINLIALPYLVYLLVGKPWWVAVCALAATMPDAVWIYRYLRYERRGQHPPFWAITRFHHVIQWGEGPWGIVTEILYFGFICLMLARLV